MVHSGWENQSGLGDADLAEPADAAGLDAACDLMRGHARFSWLLHRPVLGLTDDDIDAAKAMLANPHIGVTQIGVIPATPGEKL
jgi:hypothetical protein